MEAPWNQEGSFILTLLPTELNSGQEQGGNAPGPALSLQSWPWGTGARLQRQAHSQLALESASDLKYFTFFCILTSNYFTFEVGLEKQRVAVS